MSTEIKFFPRNSVEQVEEGAELAPKFDRDGLIPCVTTAAATGEVLMLGYMNEEALKKTIVTGEAHYWSRSRNVLWHKGATSGLVQKVVELRIDDDQDAIWLGRLLFVEGVPVPASDAGTVGAIASQLAFFGDAVNAKAHGGTIETDPAPRHIAPPESCSLQTQTKALSIQRQTWPAEYR